MARPVTVFSRRCDSTHASVSMRQTRATRARGRHARYFMTLAEMVAVGVTGKDERRWVQACQCRACKPSALFYRRYRYRRRRTRAPTCSRDGPVRPGARAKATSCTTGPTLQPQCPRPATIGCDHTRWRSWSIPQLVFTGDIGTVTARVRQVDAAFDEAGLELSPIARFAHAGLASVTGRLADVRSDGSVAIALACVGR